MPQPTGAERLKENGGLVVRVASPGHRPCTAVPLLASAVVPVRAIVAVFHCSRHGFARTTSSRGIGLHSPQISSNRALSSLFFTAADRFRSHHQ
ncbi:hypothetical protein SESBI_00625 [Sesbania bispinosa]|nr:hypothetical protein SESBI_00625 [Sesbania bispinosa]